MGGIAYAFRSGFNEREHRVKRGTLLLRIAAVRRLRRRRKGPIAFPPSDSLVG